MLKVLEILSNSIKVVRPPLAIFFAACSMVAVAVARLGSTAHDLPPRDCRSNVPADAIASTSAAGRSGVAKISNPWVAARRTLRWLITTGGAIAPPSPSPLPRAHSR